MYKFIFAFAALPFFYVSPVNALVINTTGVAVVEDFTGFTGAGFSPTPTAGQLNSDAWRITGLSDGDGVFGSTYNSGDFARGMASAGVSNGGLWSFDVDSGAGVDASLGVQPTGSDFSPGSITLRVLNGSSTTLTSLLLAYDVYVFNDAMRASFFDFSYSLDDATYIDVPSVSITSNGVADDLPEWTRFSRSLMLTGLNVFDADFFYLRWLSDDVNGSRSRDQFALDNISVTGFSSAASTPVPAPASWLLIVVGLVMVSWQKRVGRINYKSRDAY